MDKLILKNIKLKGKHGCFAHELEYPCEFWITMKIHLDARKAAKTDALEDTVDYPAAIAIAEGVIMGESVRLIEKLADKIAERIFFRFSVAKKIEVKVVKRNLENVLDEISIKIKRKREDYA
ncbi:MAG: dihydroneopterin aldolase [Opitutales bacterium]|nr:dihydroneopterin aldolase [Opitutales bacterium]